MSFISARALASSAISAASSIPSKKEESVLATALYTIAANGLAEAPVAV